MKEVTLKQFKQSREGGFVKYAGRDFPGFYKKGDSMYGDCDNDIVDHYRYQALNGIYTVYLV